MLPKMLPSQKYQLTATRGGVEVFRQGFGDREKADEAIARAMVRHRDCEVRLTEGETALVSAAPSRAAPARGATGRPRPRAF
jgi:hypothetical protein